MERLEVTLPFCFPNRNLFAGKVGLPKLPVRLVWRVAVFGILFLSGIKALYCAGDGDWIELTAPGHQVIPLCAPVGLDEAVCGGL